MRIQMHESSPLSQISRFTSGVLRRTKNRYEAKTRKSLYFPILSRQIKQDNQHT